jgi:hypothetical protein
MTIDRSIHSIAPGWPIQPCDGRCRVPRSFVTGVPSGVQELGRWHPDRSHRAITSCAQASPYVFGASTPNARQSVQSSGR